MKLTPIGGFPSVKEVIVKLPVPSSMSAMGL